MSIILAIESDRRQRDALTAVVRQRVGAELILADTTERALEAIGNRVPDLVLVPALLSPSDDAALAAALRVIAAAAHVRTLTIPVLASQSASEAKGGLFSRWRRGSTPQAADGCDPALFAEQIVAYLKESAAERELVAEQEEARFEPQETPAPADTAIDATPVCTAVTSTPAYAQAETPAFGPYDAFAATPGAQAYTRADAEIYTIADEPVSVYTPTYSYGGVQADGLEVQQDGPLVQLDGPLVQANGDLVRQDGPEVHQDGPEVHLDVPDVQVPQYARADSRASARDEVIAFVNGHDYEGLPSVDDQAATLEIEPEADIDLSDELAELEGEEVSETGGEELFDGEPIGVYSMPSLTDEPEFELTRFNFGRTRVDSFAKPEPRSEAPPEIEPAVETFAASAVDPEFLVEEIGDAAVEAAEVEPAPAVALEISAADVFDNEAVAPLEEEWDARDAEPGPADAEPWVASDLTARWGWPLLEGIPTDSPAAGFARADSLAAAAEPVGLPKPTPALWVVPSPAPAAVSRETTLPLPSISVPRPAAAAAPSPRPAASGAKGGRPEWSELVASLRKDIERRRVEPPQERPKPKAVTPASATEIVAPAPAPVMRRSRRARPIQDEWGFFDPEQCGFAALLAKLDEITEGAEEPEVRQTR